MAMTKWTLQWDVTLIAVIKKQTGFAWAQHELKVKCFYRHRVGNGDLFIGHRLYFYFILLSQFSSMEMIKGL